MLLMTALAANFARRGKDPLSHNEAAPVDATAVIFVGSLITPTAGVYAPATADDRPVTVAMSGLDNTSGADGDYFTGARCVDHRSGVHEFIVTGGAVPGSRVKAVDDNTFAVDGSPGTNDSGAVVGASNAAGTTFWVRLDEEQR